MENENIIRLTELCSKSHEGLTMEQHDEKKKLVRELVEDNLMLDEEGCYNFVNEEDGEYFKDTIKGYRNKQTWNKLNRWNDISDKWIGIAFRLCLLAVAGMIIVKIIISL